MQLQFRLDPMLGPPWRWLLLVLLLPVLAHASGQNTLPPPQTAPPAQPPLPAPAAQEAAILAWFARIPATEQPVPFGSLLLQVASVQIGKPYQTLPWQGHPEKLVYDISGFNCVTLVEESLALARCIAQQQRTVACFEAELVRNRYRHGRVDGYASRLHYFEDWRYDNQQRGLLQTNPSNWQYSQLPAVANYMTTHLASYPPLQASPVELRNMQQVEQAIAERPFSYWTAAQIQAQQGLLQTGDIVGIVGSTPGLLVSHVGIIQQNDQQQPTFLHASTTHQQVVLEPLGLLKYIQQQPKRRGILIVRPLPGSP